MMLTAAALATAVAVAAGPADGATKPRHLGAKAAAAAKPPKGTVLGGVTASSWPIVVVLDKAGKGVAQVVIGLDMTCTSGDSFGTSDGFKALPISAKGRFSTSYGPERIDAGGVPADVQSKVIGRFNKGRASMRGIWSLKITFYDPTGTTVLDTCDSGQVSWTAAQ